ncbi:MAG: hypothetical protein U5K27_20270 [Desulfotignum sp.]|nr:hypothetical protein [Desulfotignum sp.]
MSESATGTSTQAGGSGTRHYGTSLEVELDDDRDLQAIPFAEGNGRGYSRIFVTTGKKYV